MHKNTIGVGVSALVVGMLVGYMGAGVFTHPVVAVQNTRGNFATGGMMRGGNGANGGGFLTGTVAAKDAGSITLNTRDGSSHVVFITPNTNVSKSVNGTVSDVAVGSTIIVSGTTNSDGSVSATLLQLRPTAPTPVQ